MLNISTDILRSLTNPLKIIVTLCLLTYCLSVVDMSQIRVAINVVDVRWLAVAVLLVLSDTFLGASRFKILLDPIFSLPLSDHIKYYFWSTFFNLILPTSIGGDAMRVYWLKQASLPLNKGTFTILVERGLGVFSLLLLITVASFISLIPDTLKKVVWAVYALCAVGSIFFLIGIALPGDNISFRNHRINELWSSWAQIKPQLVLTFILSVFYQIVTVGVTVAVAAGFSVYLDWAEWIISVLLVWLLTLIPVGVGGLGVREFGFLTLLGAYGVTKESALLISLITYLAFLVGGLVGGICYWCAHDGG